MRAEPVLQPGRAWARKVRRTLSTAVVLPLCACGDGPAPGDSRTPADTAAWTLADTPRARIGVASGRPEYTLDRVYGGLVLPDGRIALGNSGTREVRFFDARGAYLSSVGGEGGGPGEFRGVNWIGRGSGDSVLVFDLRSQRFSVLDPRGAFARSFQLRETRASARPVGVFSDGTIAVAVEQQFDPRGGPGAVRDTIELLRVTPTGEIAGRLGRFPGVEWLIYEHPASFRTTQLPFGRSGHVAVTGEHVAYGSSDSNRLRVFDRSGAVVRTIEFPARPRRRLSEQELSAYLEEAVQDGAEREAIRHHFQGRGAAAAPVFSDLRADRRGNLWVQTFPARDGAPSKWLVLSPAGETLGSVLLPADHLPLDIDSAAVLVRETDEDGVQRVSLRTVRQ
jgi:hypothetical protein